MRVGVTLLPEVPWLQDRDRWRRAEAYGFDHAWTFDHLAWRSLADAPWYATIPTLVAAALHTSTLRLGTWVTTPNFRHPVPLAKELMTLDAMSGGRLNVGLGAGAAGWDASVLGQPTITPAERSRRFREFVTLLDLLLSQPRTTWEGEWFGAVDARNIPGPSQRPRPPFIVAANGPKGMDLAWEQAEGWATYGSAARGAGAAGWWKGVRAATARFDEAGVARARRASSIDRYLNLEALSASMTSIENFRDCVGKARELGFTDVVIAWPRAEEPFAGSEKLLDDIADELARI